MKKTILSMLCLIFAMSLLTGCNSSFNDTNKDNDDKNVSSNNYSFVELENDLKKLDSNLEVNKKSAEMIGAKEGYGYVLRECSIEVYKFDTSSNEYKTAEKEQKLNLESMDMKFDATVKNGYAYMIDETNSKCDEEVKLIEKLK